MPAVTPPPLSRNHWLWHGRIPSLDGLRALSIAAVIIHHLALANADNLPDSVWNIAMQGSIGVDVFFVISGFLITILMLRERKASGSISLPNFYLRRVFRIVPAYLTFCIAVFILNRLSPSPFPTTKFVAPFCYLTDVVATQTPWVLAHTWSLSVEEHFYLVWPVVLWLVPRKAVVIALCCIASAPLMRVLFAHWNISWIAIEYFTLTRWDTIAMGCLLAFAMAEGWTERPGRAIERYPLLCGLGALTLIAINMLAIPTLHASPWKTAYQTGFYFTVNGLNITLLVWISLECPTGLIGRLLNSRPLVLIGWLSYSLYLWQQVFINPLGSASWFVQLPVNLLLLAVTAGLSYSLVERPFLNLRARLERGRLGEAPVES